MHLISFKFEIMIKTILYILTEKLFVSNLWLIWKAFVVWTSQRGITKGQCNEHTQTLKSEKTWCHLSLSVRPSHLAFRFPPVRTGSCPFKDRGHEDLNRCPAVRRQLFEPADHVHRQPRQHIFQVNVWVACPLSLADWIRLMTAAGLCPARSEPANIQL